MKRILVAEDKVTGDFYDKKLSSKEVSALARSMVTTYGMSDKMGNLAYGKEQEHVFMGRNFGNTRDFSEEIAADIEQ